MTDVNLIFYVLTFLFTLTVTVLIEKQLIPILKKRAAQPIYDEGPVWHLSKSGTPTMGGIGFLAAMLLSLSAASGYMFAKGQGYFATSLLISLIYAVANGMIGLIDDTAKIRKKENLGLSPIQKLALQAIAATLFLIARQTVLHDGTVIYFANGAFDLGMFYYPLALIMLLGTTNSANLTDGIDGIASGVAFAIGLCLALMSANANYEVGFISFALMGATVGFLLFNLHPAKIFMGDTGSLYLGAIVSSCCFSLGNPLIILLIGGVYLIEGLSVVIQVLVFKLTKKRVFRMAPFHHHLEKCGWSENKIVIWSMIVTAILSIFASYIFI